MPWVCPICSTNNEEFENKCMVCEYERPSNKICTLTYTKVQKLHLTGNVVIPKEFNVIGEGAFKGRKDIYSVTLHANVRRISKEAFCGCSNLKSVVSESQLESIGIKAFADCTSLPVSARAKAKYEADSAYYVTPTAYTPPPPSTSTVNAKIPPSSTTSVRGTTSPSPMPKKSKGSWYKKLARILLLGICALMLIPLVNSFTSAFQNVYEAGFSTFIGVVLALLLISSIYCRFSDEEGNKYFKDHKIIPTILALIISYILLVVFEEEFKSINLLLSGALLLGELIALGKTIYKRNYRFITNLIFLIITNTILFWIIILV